MRTVYTIVGWETAAAAGRGARLLQTLSDCAGGRGAVGVGVGLRLRVWVGLGFGGGWGLSTQMDNAL